MSDDTILRDSLDIDDIKDLMEAITAWEREFDNERNFIQNMLQVDPGEIPSGMVPEDKQEEFQEFFGTMKRKWLRRNSQLQNMQPERYERAALIKAKMIMMKRRLISDLGNKLMEPSSEDSKNT